MTRCISVITAVGMLALAGCSQPAPPPDTREADAKAITELIATTQQAWTAKDAAKIANFYSDDAALYLPNTAAINDKGAIQAVLSEMFKDPALTVTIADGKPEVAKSGDIGYEKGTYTMTMTDPKSKKVMTEKGKYVTLYKKQADGSWKAHVDVINADGPAAPSK